MLVGTVYPMRAPVVEVGAPAAVPTAAVEAEVLVAVPTEAEAPARAVQAAAVPGAAGAAAIARSKNRLQMKSSL